MRFGRIGVVLAAMLAPAALFAAGRASAPKLSQQTLDNLHSALQGEAMAHAKYRLYAEHARKSGHTDLAKVFEAASRVEREEHFTELAELAGLAGSDADNLREAIQGETYEANTMYPEFARQAQAAGDTAAAERFSELAKDEAKHREAFQGYLNKLERQGRR